MKILSMLFFPSVDLITATAASEEFQRAIAAGHAEKDMAAVIEPLRKTD